MPKFLDVPSWYDEYGKENLSIGTQIIGVDAGTTVDISTLSAGIYKLKYTGNYSQTGTVTFTLSSSLSITAQFATSYMMALFNNSWFELGEINPSMGTNIFSQMLTFHNMCITSNLSSSVSNDMTILPVVGRGFALQLNYMDTGSGASMYAATVVDAGFSITFPGVTGTQSSRSIYAPTTSGSSGQLLQSSGTGAPTWMANGEEGQVLKMGSTMPTWSDVDVPTVYNAASSSHITLSSLIPTKGFAIVWSTGNIVFNGTARTGPFFVVRAYTTTLDSWYVWTYDGEVRQAFSSGSTSFDISGSTSFYYLAFRNPNG